MFGFQAKCGEGQQPKRDAGGFVVPGVCEPCPVNTYKTGTDDWKIQCLECTDLDGDKDFTLEEGSISSDQCMGEFILYRYTRFK